MKFEIIKEELEAIEKYKNEQYVSINQLLTSDVEIDIALLTQGISFEYTKDTVIQNINIIKTIYESMIKKFYNNPRRKLYFL